MGTLIGLLSAFVLLVAIVGEAPAAGLPSQSMDDNTQVFVCETPTSCNTGSPAQQSLTSAPGLATYIGSKLPATAGPLKLVAVPGNNTGAYAAPGVVSTNHLLLGLAIKDNLAQTAFNWTQGALILASNLVNPGAGWSPGTGTLADPTGQNWTGYTIIWLYQ